MNPVRSFHGKTKQHLNVEFYKVKTLKFKHKDQFFEVPTTS